MKQHSPLYTHIQKTHEQHIGTLDSWGRVLDVGTGWGSLAWMSSLPSADWTAVTVDTRRISKLVPTYQHTKRPNDRIILGDWQDPALLKGERFDVVVVDYVIGAIDAFTPYYQGELLARLRPHAKERLYLTGLEPILTQPLDAGVAQIVALDQFKAACRLHAGLRPYREYPASWVAQNLKESGFVVEDITHFPRRLRAPFVSARVAACHQLIRQVEDMPLQKALAKRLGSLEGTLLAFANRPGGIQASSNYVISARVQSKA